MLGMLGIDVSKDQLACALLDRETERLQWQRAYPNTPAGIRKLLGAAPPEVPWVVEPTGRYSLQVAQLAQQAGRQVLLAPPRHARRYLASIQDRAKTERIDAPGLAWFAATRPKNQALRPYPVNSEAVEQLEQLLTARKGLVQALTSLRQRRDELPYAAAQLTPALRALEGQLAVLEAEIATAVQAQAAQHVQRLQAIVGVGPVTATAVAARLQGRTFARADQWVAYVGLDVGIIESGRRKGQRGLTKQGDAELRRLFYLCAKSAIRSARGPFRAQYQRELDRGRSKTAALCIIARKLARVCWALVQREADYDPERVYASPRTSSAADPAASTAASTVPAAPPGQTIN